MKTKTARKSTETKGPYDKSKRTNKRKLATDSKPPTPSSSVLSIDSAASSPNPPRKGMILFRDACLDVISRFYPKTKPRNDWDVLQLGSYTKLADNPETVYPWLDERYAQRVKMLGRELTDKSVKKVLYTYVEHSGKKPRPGDPLVFIQPLPDSNYSIRLFPGSLTLAEYCMDFVDNATGEPVNSPFEHELWSVPNPDIPWLTAPMAGKLRSAERGHGIKPEDILPGEEKYFLRDGQTCVLVRPGKRSVRFTVPVRRRPGQEKAAETMDVLNFPKVVDA